jgi:NADH-quinone oxidoreductase subunit C
MISQELFSGLLNPEKGIVAREKCDRPTILSPASELTATLTKLRTDPALSFDMLCALTAVDWVAQQTIELFYELYSTKHRHYIGVTCKLPRDLAVAPSASSLWRIAEWQEREIYDLFGVLFENHPDLRRVLLDDDWVGFPLRKDYKDDFMLERPK